MNNKPDLTNATINALNFLQANSLEVSDLKIDNEWHRVKHADDKPQSHKWTGWYSFTEVETASNKSIIVGLCGSFRDGAGKEYAATFCSKQRMNAVEKQLVANKTADMKRRRLAEQKVAKRKAADSASSEWTAAKPGPHPYLDAKGIEQPYGTRVSYALGQESPTLLIPVYDPNNAIASLQKIYVDKKATAESSKTVFRKMFIKGGAMAGSSFRIGKKEDLTQKIWFAEGFATAVAVHKATGDDVIVCFFASNLEKVIKEYKQKFPQKEFYLAADNDHETEARGLKNSGIEIAEQILTTESVSYIAPQDIKGSDWDDFLRERGMDSLKEELSKIKKKSDPFIILGARGENTVFLVKNRSSENDSYSAVEVSSFNSYKSFINLAPPQYWKSKYPASIKSDAIFNKGEAECDLVDKSLSKPAVQVDTIKGLGFWKDRNDNVYFNDGFKIYSQTKEETGYQYGYVQNPVKNKTGNYFICDHTNSGFLDKNPLKQGLTNEEKTKICDSFTAFSFENASDAKLMLGGVVSNLLSPITPRRPTVHVLGPAGSGKTELNHYCAALLGDYSISHASGSTEAGIRQNMNGKSTGIILDEFEADGTVKSDRTKENIIQLLRQSWDGGRTLIRKGTVDHGGHEFLFNSGAMLFSIRPSHKDAADLSRVTYLNLDKSKHSAEGLQKLNEIQDNNDESLPQRFATECFKLYPEIVKEFEEFRKIIREVAQDSRFAEQHAMLLACARAFNPVKQDRLEMVMECLGDRIENKADIMTPAHVDMIRQVMGSHVTVNEDSTQKTMTVGSIILDDKIPLDTNNPRIDALRQIGILAQKDTLYFFHNDENLKKRVGSKYRYAIKSTLRDFPGSIEHRTRLWGAKSTVTRVVGLRLEDISQALG